MRQHPVVQATLLQPLVIARWWVFLDDINAQAGPAPILLDAGTMVTVGNRVSDRGHYSEVVSGRWDGVIFPSSVRIGPGKGPAE